MTAPTTTTRPDAARRAETAPVRLRRSIWMRGALATAVTTACNLTLWLIGRAADVGFVVPGRNGGSPVEVGPPHVVLSTVLPFVAGTAVFALVGTRSRRWRRAVLSAAALLTVASLAMPLSLDTDAWTRTLLAAMHLVTGAVFVSAMVRSEAQGKVKSE